MKSVILGLLDNSYYLDRFSRKPVPLFNVGWGNIKAVLDAYTPLLNNIENGISGYSMLYESNTTTATTTTNTTTTTTSSLSSSTNTINIQWNPYEHKSKSKKQSSSGSCNVCCRRSRKTTTSVPAVSSTKDDDSVSSSASSTKKDETVDIYEGQFRSPQASILPNESSDCKFLMVVPNVLSNDWRPWLTTSSTTPSTTTTNNVSTNAQSQLRNRTQQGNNNNNIHHSSSPISSSSSSLPTSARMNASPQVLVWLPATGEQSYSERLTLAKIMAKEQQCVSLIVMAPFYASRKENGQKGASVSTVGYYLGQSLAIMTEAAVLVLWINQLYNNMKNNVQSKEKLHICLTGFSWGAAMSGCAGILSSIALGTPPSLPFQNSAKISVVPYVGSTSPAPVVDGILSGDIAWNTLTDQGTDIVAQIDPDKVKGLTTEIMDGMKQKNSVYIRKGLLLLLQEFNNDYFLQRIIQRYRTVNNNSNDINSVKLFYSLCSCCAKNDWFLGSQYSNQLHLQLAPLVYGNNNGSSSKESSISKDKNALLVKQIWLDGGHVYAYVHRQPYQLDALRWILNE